MQEIMTDLVTYHADSQLDQVQSSTAHVLLRPAVECLRHAHKTSSLIGKEGCQTMHLSGQVQARVGIESSIYR